MRIRATGLPGIIASAFSAAAAVVASMDANADFVPFFVALTFAGGISAWAFVGSRTGLTRALALLWLLAAAWVAVLLVMDQFMGSGPEPAAERAYLGIPASLYYLVSVYAGALLVSVLAFRNERAEHRGRGIE